MNNPTFSSNKRNSLGRRIFSLSEHSPLGMDLSLEEMKAAYALYYVSPIFERSTREEYAPLTWDVRSLYPRKDGKIDVESWKKDLGLACGVRGNKRYEYSNEWPPKEIEGYVLVCGTYVPKEDIDELSERIS